jgi:hypothetical protein
MRCAVEEWFAKTDRSVAEAKAQGCIYFDCRLFSGKKGRRIALAFADGKGKKLQRTLKCDGRFQRNGLPLSMGEVVGYENSAAIDDYQRRSGRYGPQGAVD